MDDPSIDRSSRRSGTTWSQANRITSTFNDEFGHGVSLSSASVLAVGAPAYNENGERGAVYVYEQDANAPTNFISPVVLHSDSPDDIRFGYVTEVSGTMLLVGAPDDKDGGGIRLGSVFQFKHDGTSWVQQGKLFPIGDDVKAAARCPSLLPAFC